MARDKLANKPRTKLWKICFAYNWGQWRWGLLFMTLGQASQACVPFFMRKFIRWVEQDRLDSGYAKHEGWWVAGIISGCLLFKVIFDRRGRYQNFFTSMVLVCCLRGLMFGKIGKLSPAVKPYFGVGSCVNTVVNDTELLGRGVIFLHQVFIFPFVMIIFTAMLVYEVGWISLIIPLIIISTVVV